MKQVKTLLGTLLGFIKCVNLSKNNLLILIGHLSGHRKLNGYLSRFGIAKEI